MAGCGWRLRRCCSTQSPFGVIYYTNPMRQYGTIPLLGTLGLSEPAARAGGAQRRPVRYVSGREPCCRLTACALDSNGSPMGRLSSAVYLNISRTVRMGSSVSNCRDAQRGAHGKNARTVFLVVP